MLKVKTGGTTVDIGFSENLIRVRGTANLTLSAGVASLTLGTGATGFFMFERKLIRVNGVDDTQVIQLSFEDISTSLTVGSGSDGIKIAAVEYRRCLPAHGRRGRRQGHGRPTHPYRRSR